MTSKEVLGPMAREKKEKAPKKEKPPKKEKRAKKEKEQKDETLLQKLMRQAKIKGAEPEEPEAAEVPEEQEESGGRKRKLILLIAAAVLLLVAAAVVVIFVILPRFSGDDKPEVTPEPSEEPVLYDLPESFQVGEETVIGVVPVNPDGVQAELDPRISYTYTGLSDAGAEAEAYAANLRTEKFSVVDAEFVRTEAPDYTVPEGTVLLARNMAKKEAPAAGAGEGEGEGEGDDAAVSPSPAPVEEQKDMVLTVELAWSEGTMVVTCDQAEGKVTSPAQGNINMTPGASMSMSEAVDFLYELSPSVLGLSGDSMEGYRIYALDGAVLVNGQPCMRLNIYSREESDNSNNVAGIYLMSRDGQHLYLLDEEAERVTELELP